jgi:hypothetical protein
MPNKLKPVLTIFFIFLLSDLMAQNFYFTGVGRALVNNTTLKDNTNNASMLKGSAGYTLFDLGIYAKANEVLRGGVILRTKNAFGGFFGDGSSLLFRQMQMEGLIAKKVFWEIGDIYLKHTKYTLWNEDNMYHKYESNLFSLRRDIVNYENFYVGNAWRMQGINSKSKINFNTKGIESIGIRAYGGRTMQTNFTTTPERYFYGGRLDLTQSKVFRIAGNLAGIKDIAGTVTTAEVAYSNMVATTDFDLTIDKIENFKLVLSGETGLSRFDLKRPISNTDNQYKDFFYDGGGKLTYKPLNFTIGASYRNVGSNFNSPMAQTRRMAQPSDITLQAFPNLNNGISLRPITLFDMYSQESGLYNQAISTTLMNYFIQYDMVEPYGRATPNRKGYTFSAEVETPSKVFNASVEANFLSEVVAEGDSVTMQKRKFTLIRGGFVFNIHKLLNIEKVIAINAGGRTESSVRGGTNAVKLNSALIDLGIDVEVIKDLHLLGGTKLFTVKGNEYTSIRNNLNQIQNWTGVNFNQQQNTIATGLRYDYGTGGYFSMHYHLVNYKDLNSSSTYKLNQVFFVFGMKF